MGSYSWFFYILSILILTYLATYYLRSNRWYIFSFLTVLLITPTRGGVSSSYLSPSIATFLYDIILERSLSTITLRPLVISSAAFLIISLAYFYIKRRFFQKKGR